MAMNPRGIRLLASAARTAAPTDAAITRVRDSGGYRGIRIVVDVTAQTATPAVTVTLQGYIPELDKYYDVLVGTAITNVTGTGTYVYKVFPGATPSAGAVANDHLPPNWRVNITAGDTDSQTYSVDVELLNG